MTQTYWYVQTRSAVVQRGSGCAGIGSVQKLSQSPHADSAPDEEIYHIHFFFHFGWYPWFLLSVKTDLAKLPANALYDFSYCSQRVTFKSQRSF